MIDVSDMLLMNVLNQDHVTLQKLESHKSVLTFHLLLSRLSCMFVMICMSMHYLNRCSLAVCTVQFIFKRAFESVNFTDGNDE